MATLACQVVRWVADEPQPGPRRRPGGRHVDTAAPDCVDSDGVTVFRVPAAAVRIDEAATAVD